MELSNVFGSELRTELFSARYFFKGRISEIEDPAFFLLIGMLENSAIYIFGGNLDINKKNVFMQKHRNKALCLSALLK